MSAITAIEASIQTLSSPEFFKLLGWMADRRLEVLSAGEAEAPELEAALLQAIDSPRHPVNDALFQEIRDLAREV